ncbi:hypothetical protein M8R20_10975 [Pseudomonas sp. R2.Fl]|nr:hypothetical protein [Pseudomonas sp. R2.Fl]
MADRKLDAITFPLVDASMSVTEVLALTRQSPTTGVLIDVPGAVRVLTEAQLQAVVEATPSLPADQVPVSPQSFWRLTEYLQPGAGIHTEGTTGSLSDFGAHVVMLDDEVLRVNLTPADSDAAPLGVSPIVLLGVDGLGNTRIIGLADANGLHQIVADIWECPKDGRVFYTGGRCPDHPDVELELQT